jgi:RNA polymerase sigma-70 factor (ECF subfamily)
MLGFRTPFRFVCWEFAMVTEHTTAVVQRYLEALSGDQPAEPIVRALLDRSVRRLELLCGNLL